MVMRNPKTIHVWIYQESDIVGENEEVGLEENEIMNPYRGG